MKNKNFYSNNYSINLLFINKNEAPESQKFIASGIFENQLHDNVVKWAKNNPNATINIWYDSKLYKHGQKENTENIIKTKISTEKINCDLNKICFRDINEIPVVKENETFFAEDMQLYFKIDILKLIINFHSLTHDKKAATIFSDFSDRGKDITEKEMFSDESLEILENFGSMTNFAGLENQFIEMINDDTTIYALRHEINLCLVRAQNMFYDPTFNGHLPTLYKVPFIGATEELPRIVYLLKNGGFKTYKCILDQDSISNELVEYNPDKDGYDGFGSILSTARSAGSLFTKIKNNIERKFDENKDLKIINVGDDKYIIISEVLLKLDHEKGETLKKGIPFDIGYKSGRAHTDSTPKSIPSEDLHLIGTSEDQDASFELYDYSSEIA